MWTSGPIPASRTESFGGRWAVWIAVANVAISCCAGRAVRQVLEIAEHGHIGPNQPMMHNISLL